MQCPDCGQANRTGAKFCDECGTPLPVRPVGTIAPLSSAPSTLEPPQQNRPAAPDPAQPHTGRRQLTVMFCDIVGSTALTGQLDPEEWRDIVRTYQDTCAGVIQRFGGYIAQYLGDGLLVYFGYPIAHEDAAVRAVKTGLGILAQLGHMNSQLQKSGRLPSLRQNGQGKKDAPRIRLRIGVHTGQVVVSDVGAGERHEHLALGETPNIAAHLQAIAKANTVVMSAASYRLVEGFFECRTLGPHALKGRATPIAVYQVLGEEGARSRFDVALEAGLTPLVGRAEELAFLQQRWEQAKVGEGQVVLLSGEPGIGKSRLVQELKEQVAKAGEARREFRCSSYARNTALYSVIDHLQRWLQFQGDEPEEEKFRRLETALAGYRRLPAEGLALFASLLALALPERYAPLDLSPERQRQKMQEALVAWLAEEAAERPLLIVWEDLHWTDPSTLDLVRMLIERAATLHLFVLLVFRPSEFTPPWPPQPPVHFLPLSRLERRPVEDLITYIAQGQRLPPHMVEHIAAQTDGIPLFVEELTKTVIESGLPENDGGGAPSLSGAIPTTLQDSLMARLDQLSSIAREVAQIGAVLGRAFSYELIRAVWPADEQRLARGLAQLVEAELVFQKGLPPQARWVFKHALLQDTAYQSLLKSKRQQLHQQVAAVLVKQFPDIRHQQPELVAYHYTEAGLLDQAIGFWQYAGEQAVQRSAHREGIGHFAKGLELLSQLPETPDRSHRELTIQTRLGPSLMATKGYAAPEVERAYTRAQELCQQLGKTPQSFPVLRGLWVVHEMRAELRAARELSEQLLALAQELDDPDLLIEVHRALGNTLLWLGEFAHAREHLQKAVALYKPEQHKALAFQYGTDPRIVCLLYETLALWVLGYPDQALHKNREALTLAEEAAHPHSLVGALVWTGFLHQLRYEATLTHERGEAVVALAQQHGFPHWEMIGAIFREWATAAHRHTEASVEHLRAGIAAWRVTGAELLRPYFLGLLAEQYGKVGRIDTGLALLDEALAVVNTSAERFSEAELYRLRGELLLGQEEKRPLARMSRTGPNSEAESCFHKALLIARQQGAKSWELRAATSLAQQWLKQGKRGNARRVLTETTDWFTEGRETRDFQAAQALLAELV